MKIKLAILEKDTSYLHKIVSVFNTKYADKFEIYSFTNQDVALETLEPSKIDVLLVDDTFEVAGESLPKRCALAYFVESPDIDSVNDQWAIFKYQKIELIYKQILSLYAENASKVAGLKMDEGSCKLIVFSAASGGVGASCMAAACALNYAQNQKRVLYLNLEKFGHAELFFKAEGQFTMSDVVFAMKSKKPNLGLKLESFVRRTSQGVFYFAPSQLALDMLELNTEEIMSLVSELKLTGSYDYIIADCDFSLEREELKFFRGAHAMVLVCDGSTISNEKTARAYKALSVLEQNADIPLTSRVKLVYNRFSNKIGKVMNDLGADSLGGAPVFAHAEVQEVVKQLSGMNLFERII